MTDNEDRHLIERAIRIICVAILTFIFLALACVMSGCRTRTEYVPAGSVRVEYVEADTSKFTALINSLREQLRQKESRTESLVHKETEKETVTVNNKGDTIGHKRDHTVYIHLSEKEQKEYENIITSQNDTILMLRQQLESVKTDTIPMPYPVERKLTKWERVKMDFGGMAIGGLAVVVIAVVWLVFRKRRR